MEKDTASQEPERAPQTTSIFVSYSRSDQKRAMPVIAGLEQAGFRVWWDGLLEGGDSFLPTTEAALEGADAVIVIWSKTSVASHWVRDEATVGRDRRRLVPLSLDGSEAPLGFRQFQLIDIAKWRGNAAAPEFQRVIRAVSGLTGAVGPPAFLIPGSVRRGSFQMSRRMMVGGGAVLATAAAALATWQFKLIGGAPALGNSVAVMPFRNLSGDPDENYFAEGLAEEIRTALSRNAALKVLAPTSALTFRADPAAPDDLARKLGVAFLLDGSVRRSGNMLRISATLTDASSGFVPWRDQFDRPMADIFAIQSDIADNVAAALAAQTTGTERVRKQGTGGTSDVQAHDAYLRGNAYYELRTGEASMRAALAQYDAAIEADPKFAEAHAQRARVRVLLAGDYARGREYRLAAEDAIASAREAVRLAPRLAVAQSTLGYVLVQGLLDFKAAREPNERARALGWGDASVMLLYAAYCTELSRAVQAKESITRSVELDPLNPGVFRAEAFVRYYARDYAGAIESSRRALSLNPKMGTVHSYAGLSQLQLGRVEDARREFLAEPVELINWTGLAIAEHRLGNYPAAQAATDRLIAKFTDAASYQLAQIYAQWGKVDEALAKLELALALGDGGLVVAKVDPLLDPLRTRLEFSRLLNRLGLA
jgi:TolB-like protein